MAHFKSIVLISLMVYGTAGGVLVGGALIGLLFQPTGTALTLTMGALGAGIGLLICGVLQVIIDLVRERPFRSSAADH